MDRILFFRYLLEFALLIPSCVCAMLPMWGYLRIRKWKAVGLAALMLVLVIGSGAWFCMSKGLPTNYVFLPSMLILLTAYCAIIRLPLDKKLFCFFNAALPGSFCTLYAIYWLAPLEMNNAEPALLAPTAALAVVLYLILIAAYGRLLSVEIPFLFSVEMIDTYWRWLAAVVFVLTGIVFWTVPSDASRIMAGGMRGQARVMLLLLPIGYYIVVHMLWRVIWELTKHEQLSQENTLLLLEQKRYEELREYLDATRNLRHDFRQHMLVIRRLLEEGKTEELKTYLEPMDREAEHIYRRLAGNAEVDAVAAHYDLLATQKGIRVGWKLELPETLPVKAADLCSILGNLLENAIQASGSLPEEKRWVEVSARMLSGVMVGLTVTNPFEGNIRFDKDGLPVTRRRGHGIGLRSVSQIAANNGGTLDIRAEKGIFSAAVILCGT